MNFDIIVVGSGPGGYVAAIRASQLGKKVAIVERTELGGICLNWGCIPTKALLKSAHVYSEMRHCASFGVELEGTIKPNFTKIIERSRGVSATMSKGVQFLLKKNNVEVIEGFATLLGTGLLSVKKEGEEAREFTADNIILATGARAKEFPNLKADDHKVITYRRAMSLEEQPESMIVVGSGAIGVELASFYHELGTKVTIVEFLPNLVPTEDVEVAKYLERSFRKAKLSFMTSTSVTNIDASGDKCVVTLTNAKGESTMTVDKVLLAVGVTPNVENMGLEQCGVAMDRGKVKVDGNYMTSLNGVYAIGDIIPTAALAHVASAEAICCVERICGLTVPDVDYTTIPACIYTSPEIASVGMKEAAAREAGYNVKTGMFPYTASGKATATDDKDGFIKLVVDGDTDKLLGAHFIGTNVTEMIMEASMVKSLGGTVMNIIKTVHPHPTLSEAVMEAAAAVHGEAIHI